MGDVVAQFGDVVAQWEMWWLNSRICWLSSMAHQTAVTVVLGLIPVKNTAPPPQLPEEGPV